MPDTNQSSEATEGPDRPTYLARLLDMHTESATWIAATAVDPVTGEKYTRQTTSKIMRGDQTSIPIPLIRGIAAVTDLTHQELWDASGYASGLDVGPAGHSTLAQYWPPVLDQLSERSQYALRDVALALARAEGLID